METSEMTQPRRRKKRLFVRILLVLCLIFAALCIIFAVYVRDYYHADQTAAAAVSNPIGYTVEEIGSGNYVFWPPEESRSESGFIFYPGGKVEYTAYAPLMGKLAERGITCILVEMPFNLAIMNVNAADGLQETCPDVKNWYIGGHSLGGVSASMYLKDHADEYRGLILLGAYSSADLSDTDLAVLLIHGDCDQVLNMEKYEEAESNLPSDATEYIIEGGNHCGFGNYGQQDGDGTASITAEEEQEICADVILSWMQDRE